MPKRRSVVRRLSVVITGIVMLVTVTAAVVNGVIGRHYALESVRQVLRFNSESILSGIDKLMMHRDNNAVSEFIDDVARESTVYRNIRLVSHYSGRIVVSRLNQPGASLRRNDPSCAICHDRGEDFAAFPAVVDEIRDGPNGSRILHVTTPILNESSCATAACHAHSDSGPTLGFLQTEYSLDGVDILLSDLQTSFATGALAAVSLGILALWVMFKQTFTKPITHMLAGIQAISGGDFSFRFNTTRRDEFGLVEDAFDDMAQTLQTHQTELQNAREHLEGIVENSADIIITVSPQGLIQSVNRGAEQALGYQRQELIGKRIELLFADPRERDLAIARLQDQDHVSNYETHFLTKNRDVKTVLLTLSRLRNREGLTIGTLGISKDITNEKRLESLLVQSQTAAAIGQAATAIQHAIKNMLNTLAGGSYLVRHGSAKNHQDTVAEGIQMIDEGILKIRSLSLNILKYARAWTIEPELTDMEALLSDVYKAVKHTAAEEGISVYLRISDPLPVVSCDTRLIHMALMDIATNAVDACRARRYDDSEAPEILLRLYPRDGGGAIVVEVQDNGIGMTDEVRSKIHTPFFTTKTESGTGLGLALTARVMKLHGGEIQVESALQRGSIFRLILPVEDSNTKKGARHGEERASYR